MEYTISLFEFSFTIDISQSYDIYLEPQYNPTLHCYQQLAQNSNNIRVRRPSTKAAFTWPVDLTTVGRVSVIPVHYIFSQSRQYYPPSQFLYLRILIRAPSHTYSLIAIAVALTHSLSFSLVPSRRLALALINFVSIPHSGLPRPSSPRHIHRHHIYTYVCYPASVFISFSLTCLLNLSLPLSLPLLCIYPCVAYVGTYLPTIHTYTKLTLTYTHARAHGHGTD